MVRPSSNTRLHGTKSRKGCKNALIFSAARCSITELPVEGTKNVLHVLVKQNAAHVPVEQNAENHIIQVNFEQMLLNIRRKASNDMHAW